MIYPKLSITMSMYYKDTHIRIKDFLNNKYFSLYLKTRIFSNYKLTIQPYNHNYNSLKIEKRNKLEHV